jgi:hypothetical protein
VTGFYRGCNEPPESWRAEELLASQENLCSLELFNFHHFRFIINNSTFTNKVFSITYATSAKSIFLNLNMTTLTSNLHLTK